MTTLLERIESQGFILEENEHARFVASKEIVLAEDLEALESYLSKGYSINVRNKSLETVAFEISYMSLRFTKILVEKELDLHVLNSTMQNILFGLNLNTSLETMTYLLQQNINPYERDVWGISVLESRARFFNYISADFIKSNAPFWYDLDNMKDEMLAGNFGLALSIIENKIKRLGGIEKLASLAEYLHGYRLIETWLNLLLKNTLIRHGKYRIRVFFNSNRRIIYHCGQQFRRNAYFSVCDKEIRLTCSRNQ